ncbi:MAG: relaxase/mobilization nuclease domain-containing protein [Cetobacterium sp.]|uniref:relaxase/mobilization nuclease domain-containing protein n=1 Tax=Cetobacterium sp. TaxID=2071632 RepID=UPI003F381404
MGKIAILKAINSKSTGKGSSKGLEDYLNKEKVLKTGIDCDCDNWSSDFRLTKAVFDNLEGRQYKHFTQAFEKESGLSEEQIHKAGIDLVKMCKQFEGFQAVIITHNDKEHLHNHIVINSVNSETGKKFRMSNSELKTLKKNMDKYLKQEFGLEPTKEKEGIVKTQNTKTYQAIKRSLEGNYKSFTLNLAKDIKKSLDESTTQEELKVNLEKKDIKMDISESHNTIMFVDKNKKKVSSKKLKEIFGVNFDKESIEKQIEYNLKIKEMINPRGFNEIKNAKPMELELDKFESYQDRLKRLEKERGKKYELEKQEKDKLKEEKEATKIRVIQRAPRERERGMER